MMLDLWFKRRGTGLGGGLEMLILHIRGRRPNMKQKDPPIKFWGGTDLEGKEDSMIYVIIQHWGTPYLSPPHPHKGRENNHTSRSTPSFPQVQPRDGCSSR